MKLALATLFFAAPAAAFAPTASFGVNTALQMSTEAATEKVSVVSFERTKELDVEEQIHRRHWRLII